MPGERTARGEETEPLADLLEQYLACFHLERGQILSGTVVRVSATEVIVDIGAKCEGIVPERDLERLTPDERRAIRVGDQVAVCVVTPEDANGNIILSLSRARQARDWLEGRRLWESQEVIEREVIACNKGGVIVPLGGLRGFVPGSQLVSAHESEVPDDTSEDERRWAYLIGRTLRLKVIEVDEKRNRLILSERAAARESQGDRGSHLMDELTEGEIRHGRVVNLASFGAFVDLGGMDGLIHLSELSWRHVEHPREVLEVGQEIDVYVLGVDRTRQRVALSLKRLQPDPWSTVASRYHVGQIVEGIVTRIVKWGAFASIVGDEAIEGLIHISELDEKEVAHPHEVVQVGQRLLLRVIGVDAAHHRLALSRRQVFSSESEVLRNLVIAPAPLEPSIQPWLAEDMRARGRESGQGRETKVE